MKSDKYDIQDKVIYTIGHSNHTAAYFMQLLKKHGITAVADVRSVPYSRYNPQFNKRNISRLLISENIAYVFLGKELGGKARGAANTSLSPSRPGFQEGIKRLLNGCERYRVAIFCAEKDPMKCHRTFLVGKEIQRQGVTVKHILEDGNIKQVR